MLWHFIRWERLLYVFDSRWRAAISHHKNISGRHDVINLSKRTHVFQRSKNRPKPRRGTHGQQWTPSAVFLPIIIARWLWYSLNHPISNEVSEHYCHQGHYHYHGQHHRCSHDAFMKWLHFWRQSMICGNANAHFGPDKITFHRVFYLTKFWCCREELNRPKFYIIAVRELLELAQNSRHPFT